MPNPHIICIIIHAQDKKVFESNFQRIRKSIIMLLKIDNSFWAFETKNIFDALRINLIVLNNLFFKFMCIIFSPHLFFCFCERLCLIIQLPLMTLNRHINIISGLLVRRFRIHVQNGSKRFTRYGSYTSVFLSYMVW